MNKPKPRHLVQVGKIKRITDRGFGFLALAGTDRDLFFHAKELINAEFNELREGDQVEFDIVNALKGQNAINVSRLGHQFDEEKIDEEIVAEEIVAEETTDIGEDVQVIIDNFVSQLIA